MLGKRVTYQVITRLSAVGIAFFCDLFFVRFFDLAYFGYFAATLALTQVLGLVGSMGSASYSIVIYARYSLPAKQRWLSAATSWVLFLGITSTAFFSSAVIALLFRMGLLDEFSLLLPLCCVLYTCFEILRHQYRTDKSEWKGDSFLLVVLPVVLLCVAILARYLDLFSSPAAIICVSLVFVNCFLLRRTARNRSRRVNVELATLVKRQKKVIGVWSGQAFSLAGSSIFSSAQLRADVILMSFLTSPAIVGSYQIVSRFSLLTLFLLRSLQSVAQSDFAEQLRLHPLNVIKGLNRTAIYSLAFGLVIYFVCWQLFDFASVAYGTPLQISISVLHLLFLARLALCASGGAAVLIHQTPARASIGRNVVGSMVVASAFMFGALCNGFLAEHAIAFGLLILNVCYCFLTVRALRAYLSVLNDLVKS